MTNPFVEHTTQLPYAPQTVPAPDHDLRRADWPALHQGMCGNCYSYAAAAAVESANGFVHVSENELTACSSQQGANGGCSGGWFAQTLQMMAARSYGCLCEAQPGSLSTCRVWHNGPLTLGGGVSYGAGAAMHTCQPTHPGYIVGCVNATQCSAAACSPSVPVLGYRAYTSGSYLFHGYTDHCGLSTGLSCADTISAAIKGPSGRAVAVAIDALGGSHGGLVNDDFWGTYTGDTPILYGGCNPEVVELNHAVAIVGEVNSHNPPYWIVRNSWGDQWHDQGHFYVEKGINSCGIESRIAYVTSTPAPPTPSATLMPTPPPSPLVTRAVPTAAPTPATPATPAPTPAPTSYVACSGKSDGDSCTLCAPQDPDCVETAVVKQCQSGECVSSLSGECRSGQRMALVGDSITVGWDSSYKAALAAKLGGAVTLENLGVNSSTAKSYQSTSAYGTLLSRHWNVSVLMFGTNEILSGMSNESEFVHEYVKLISSVAADEILLMVPPQSRGSRPRMDALVPLVESIAASLGLAAPINLIPVVTEFMDDLHPSAAGNAQIASAVHARLQCSSDASDASDSTLIAIGTVLVVVGLALLL